MIFTVHDVLGAMRDSRDTAQGIAHALGAATPVDVLPILNSLRGEGRVVRRVDVNGAPVARWGLA